MKLFHSFYVLVLCKCLIGFVPLQLPGGESLKDSDAPWTALAWRVLHDVLILVGHHPVHHLREVHSTSLALRQRSPGMKARVSYCPFFRHAHESSNHQLDNMNESAPLQKMQPIFNNSGNEVGGGRWTPNKSEARRPLEPISIPVRHVGRQLSTDATDGPAAVTLRGEGLQSPSVLMQSIKPARRQSNREERNNADRRLSFTYLNVRFFFRPFIVMGSLGSTHRRA